MMLIAAQKEAWVSGARFWSDEQREAFANEYVISLRSHNIAADNMTASLVRNCSLLQMMSINRRETKILQNGCPSEKVISANTFELGSKSSIIMG
jgi:hypothetical protein